MLPPLGAGALHSTPLHYTERHPLGQGPCTAHLCTTQTANELGANPATAREMFKVVLTVVLRLAAFPAMLLVITVRGCKSCHSQENVQNCPYSERAQTGNTPGYAAGDCSARGLTLSSGVDECVPTLVAAAAAIDASALIPTACLLLTWT